MTQRSTRIGRGAAVISVALLAACSASSSRQPNATTASAASAANGTNATSTAGTAVLAGATDTLPGRSDVGIGPGDFVLGDPMIGLDALGTYSATYTASFEGTVSGKARTWTKTTTMNRRAEPLAAVATVTVTGDAPAQFPALAAETHRTAYWVDESGSCDAGAIDPAASLVDTLEPAYQLSGVVGAESIGSKDIDGHQADGYRFDQRAVARDVNEATSSGELWVAHDSGVVLDYQLTTKAGAKFFGANSEGTLRETYTLTDIDADVTIDLPDDCPPPMLDPPVPDGSMNVEPGPGMLSFDTTTSIADVIAFYDDAAPSLGWSATDVSVVGDQSGVAAYTFGERQFVVLVISNGASNSVVISDAAPPPQGGNGNTAGSTGGNASGGATITISGGHSLSAQWPLVPDMSFVAGGTLTFTDPARPLPDGSFLTLVLAPGMENLSFSDGQMTIMAGTDACTFSVDQANGFHGAVSCPAVKGVGGVGGTVSVDITVDVSA